MNIPRIIHQTWKSPTLPRLPALCVRSVRTLNPAWDYALYSDEDLETVVAESEIFPAEEFRRIPSGIEKADIFRAAVLYTRGGIYCDIDIEAIEPFDRLLSEVAERGLAKASDELWLTTDHPIHCNRLYGRTMFMNHFMVAAPGSRILEIYLREMARASSEGRFGGDPVKTTGPAAITRLLDENGGPPGCHVAVIPSDWINPLPDMTWDFPELRYYDMLIRSCTWREELKPFLAHHWWHNYCDRPSNFAKYGDLLFKTIEPPSSADETEPAQTRTFKEVR